jgi:hypothetical protein
MHQQNQRLLDMPRPRPQDAPGRVQAPRRTQGDARYPDAPTGQPGASLVGSRSGMRQRIVALLRDYPEGLTPGEMQARLGVARSLTDTCQGMLRYGLLRRLERGRYVVTTPSPHEP